jgi:hypothetical protein
VYNYDKKYISNGTFTAFNDTEGLSKLNTTMFFTQELKKMIWSYAIMLRTTGREYDRLLNKGTIDTCNVQKGILGNMIVKYIKDSVDPAYSNFKYQCPQPPGLMYIYNFPAFDIKNLPRFLIASSREELEFTAILRAKFSGVKGLAYVMSIKVYAEILLRE